MLALFSICAAIELLLVMLEGLLPRAAKMLPLGGSHLAQIGVLFGLAWVAVELISGVQRAIITPFSG